MAYSKKPDKLTPGDTRDTNSVASKLRKKKSMRPGGGGRFAAMVGDLTSEKGMSTNRAKAIAASAGRKKYGKKKFQAMAAAGRKRA